MLKSHLDSAQWENAFGQASKQRLFQPRYLGIVNNRLKKGNLVFNKFNLIHTFFTLEKIILLIKKKKHLKSY